MRVQHTQAISIHCHQLGDALRCLRGPRDHDLSATKGPQKLSRIRDSRELSRMHDDAKANGEANRGGGQGGHIAHRLGDLAKTHQAVEPAVPTAFPYGEGFDCLSESTQSLLLGPSLRR